MGNTDFKCGVWAPLATHWRRPCEEPGGFEVDKTCVDVFGILPRFLENLLESEGLVSYSKTQVSHVVFRGYSLEQGWGTCGPCEHFTCPASAF